MIWSVLDCSFYFFHSINLNPDLGLSKAARDVFIKPSNLNSLRDWNKRRVKMCQAGFLHSFAFALRQLPSGARSSIFLISQDDASRSISLIQDDCANGFGLPRLTVSKVGGTHLCEGGMPLPPGPCRWSGCISTFAVFEPKSCQNGKISCTRTDV